MTAHARDDVLARYALDPALVQQPETVEQHLLECKECRDALERIRELDALLAEGDSWIGLEEESSPARSALLAFGERVASEDRDAKHLLAEFESAPAARFVWANLPGRASFRIAGVVRLLNARANAMCDRDPRYALVLAETATEIADLLSEENYPIAALHEWRGETWKEQANALYSLGRFPEALRALDRAEGEYNHLPHAGIGAVAVAYVRGLVLCEQENFDDAERFAESSAHAALHLGVKDRYMAARTLHGKIALQRKEFRRAAEIFDTAFRYGQSIDSAVWTARESLNLGLCYLELGELPRARRNFEMALLRFSELGFEAEVTRTRWAIARLSFAESAVRGAGLDLQHVVADFTRLGMLTDAAIAAVHLAEMLVAMNRSREIRRVLDGVVRTFTRAGKLTGALTALAYLKDAAATGSLTTEVASHVRTYLRRVERRPELAFELPHHDEV